MGPDRWTARRIGARRLIIWRAAARAVIKRDLTIVTSGIMNSSIDKSMVVFPFPSSLGRGRLAWRTMSSWPVCSAMLPTYWFTPASSRVSITAVCAFPAARRNLFGQDFKWRPRAAGQKDSRTFGRELLCDCSPNGAAGAENNGVLILQRVSIHGVLHCAMTRALTISLLPNNKRPAVIAIFASIGLTCAAGLWPAARSGVHFRCNDVCRGQNGTAFL